MNNCAFCTQKSKNIAWDETSHLGKRPICYDCIGLRDLRKMRSIGRIVLYRKNQYLINQVQTLKLKIVTENNNELFFLFEKKKWVGKITPHCDRIFCRTLK